MRKLLPALLSVLLLLAGCQTQAATPLPDSATAEEEKVSTPEIIESDEYSTESFPGWDERDIFKSGLIPSQQHYLEELADAPIYHLDYEIDADLVTIRGHEEISYTNQENVPLDKIVFHLFPNILGGEMSIGHVSVNEDDVSVEYGIQNSTMSVLLPAPLQPKENIAIAIDFTTIVPTELENNYGVLASTEGVLALAHAYPMLSVYDDEGWNTALPAAQGDVTYGDASFYIVRVNAPKELVLVSSGNEITGKVEGDRLTRLFAIGPARDFYLAVSADYNCIKEAFATYTIKSCAPAEMKDGAEMALNVAAEALEIFGEAYAPYPYTEFDIASIPTYALGIEYPGMTALNVNIYDLSADFNGTPASIYLESTVAHEVGHQWFYNLVGNDQLDEPWLDESLAQYITWQYYNARYGESAGTGFSNALNDRWGRIDYAEVAIGKPVTAYSDKEYSGIVYGRGAFFFEALKNEMGTERFDAFLAEYTQSQEWDIASAESLRALAEKDCNCDLENLFNEWIY